MHIVKVNPNAGKYPLSVIRNRPADTVSAHVVLRLRGSLVAQQEDRLDLSTVPLRHQHRVTRIPAQLRREVNEMVRLLRLILEGVQ